MCLQQTKLNSSEELQRLLEAKRAELMASHRHADAITIERVPDSMDQLVFANERDLAVDTLNREAILLRQVSEALERLAVRAYGVCVVCKEPISSRRLVALPWAALCLRCQEAEDDRQGSSSEASLSALLSDAA